MSWAPDVSASAITISASFRIADDSKMESETV